MSNFNLSNDEKLSMVIIQNFALINAMKKLENKVDELEIRLIETEQYSEFLGKKISKLNCQKKRKRNNNNGVK